MKSKVFLKWVHKKVTPNGSCIIVVNGATGSGKSYACLKLAEDISEMFGSNFSVANNLAFKFSLLLKKMQLPDNDKFGTVFIMEEVGAFGSGASAREWQGKANKFFNSFCQTSRHKNQVLILNCPSFSYLEYGTRQLCHAQLEALGVNYSNKQSYFKPFIIQCNRRTGKLYFKYIRYRIGGVRRYMNKLRFGLPDQEMLAHYEKEKTMFTTQLNKEMLQEDKPKVVDIKKNVEKNIGLVNALRKAGKTILEISKLLNVSTSQVDTYIRRIKDQGPLGGIA